MDIRARTLISFTPLMILLVSMVVALPIIERRDQGLLAEQIAAADDLSDTQALGINLLLQHVAVGQIARAYISPKSERYTVPHAEIARHLARHTGIVNSTQEFDLQTAEVYAELGRRYEEIVAFAQAGNLVTAQQIYSDPRTLQLLDRILAFNQDARDAARATISESSQRTEVAQRHAFQTIVIALVVGILIAATLGWILVSQIVRPIERLTADAEHYASGDLAGQLSAISSVGQLRRLRESFQRLLDSNTSRQGRLQQSLAELSERVAREEHLRETVHALSVPVVPLREDMLLLPLIGHLDERRAAEMTRSLLDAIYASRARAVVLDITGLADLDAAGSAALSQTIDAARLLGCRVYLVGVRASQAIALSESNLALANVTIARDISSILTRA